MRQSKTLILSTNVDQKSLETGFSFAICRPIFRLPCVARVQYFNHIKFSSFIVVMFVLLSITVTHTFTDSYGEFRIKPQSSADK